MKLTVFYDHINQSMRQTGKSFEELARDLTAAGISGVEMDYGELVKKPRRLCKALRKAGLPVSCVYAFFDWGNPGSGLDYKKVIRLLARCDVPHMLAIPGFVEHGQDREVSRARMAQTLKQCCGYAAKYGITVGMEDLTMSAQPLRGRKSFSGIWSRCRTYPVRLTPVIFYTVRRIRCRRGRCFMRGWAMCIARTGSLR